MVDPANRRAARNHPLIRDSTRFGFILFALAVCASDGAAFAGPTLGTKRPVAAAVDPDGHALDLGALPGKTVVLFYEDRHTALVNAKLKDSLRALRKDAAHGERVAIVPVADVSSYNFWPARYFAKRAVRGKIKQYGERIYCDWTGKFRAAYGLREGVANVIVIGKNGDVLFFKEGKLTPAEVERVLALARAHS